MFFIAYYYKVLGQGDASSPGHLPHALTFALLPFPVSSLNLCNPLCTLFSLACECGLQGQESF